jgi:hypothetical protein
MILTKDGVSYKTPRLIRPMTATLLRLSSWTFQSRGIGLVGVSPTVLQSRDCVWHKHDGSHPVCDNVHGRTGVVGVGKNMSRLAVSPLLKQTRVPGGPAIFISFVRLSP